MGRTRKKVRTLSRNRGLVRQQRQHIAAAAFQVFAQAGYEKTTVREIARRAEMTPGNIYRYVGSKDDILHLLCQRAYDDTRRVTQSFNKNLNNNSNVTEALGRSIKNYLKWSDEFSDAFLFYDRNAQSLTEEDRALVRDTWNMVVNFFEQLIRKGIRRGEFKVKHPLLLAHNIASLGHVWGMRKWYLSKHYSLSDYTKKQIEMVMNSLIVVQNQGEKEQEKKTSKIHVKLAE